MMTRWLVGLLVAAATAGGARAVLAHGEVMEVGSTANGSGALTLIGFDFAEKIIVPPTFVGPTTTLYSTIFPSFEFPTTDQPAVPFFRLPDGIPLTLQIACDGPICIDPGASVRTNVIADATGETCSLGTVKAGEHFHPEWRLILPNGVFGDYRLPFRITTTAPGYSPSQVYVLTLTNINPTPTATPTTDQQTPTPTRTPTSTATLPAGICPSQPVSGCRSQTGKTTLLLKRKATKPSKDRLVWKWLQGEAVGLAELGDPLNATAHRLCVYDEGASGFTRVVELQVPAGGNCGGTPCWAATAAGFKYKERTGAITGISGITLKSGVTGKTKVIVEGKGATLALPDLPLQQNTRVRVQLHGDPGSCWESTFDAPATQSDAEKFADTAG